MTNVVLQRENFFIHTTRNEDGLILEPLTMQHLTEENILGGGWTIKDEA